MVIKDTTKIEKAIPLYPDIMSDKAGDKLIEKFNHLQDKMKWLSNLKSQVISMQDEVDKLEDDFRRQSDLFEIIYAEKEIKEIKETSNLCIVNPSDYRNN